MYHLNLVVIFIFVLNFDNCNAEMLTSNSPRVKLESSKGVRGSLTVVAKNYPDLSVVGFNNKAQIACVTGTWIFYGSKNYANFSDGVSVQYSNNNKCFKFQNLNEKVSSMRFAGSGSDFRLDYLDLYSGRFFTGAHLRANWDIKDVTATGLSTTESVIVSGDSGWTLYEKPFFSGISKCITPQSGKVPRFYRNSLELGGMIIKSFRKGC